MGDGVAVAALTLNAGLLARLVRRQPALVHSKLTPAAATAIQLSQRQRQYLVGAELLKLVVSSPAIIEDTEMMIDNACAGLAHSAGAAWYSNHASNITLIFKTPQQAEKTVARWGGLLPAPTRNNCTVVLANGLLQPALRLESVSVLLECGVDMTRSESRRALAFAVARDFTAVAARLLEAGGTAPRAWVELVSSVPMLSVLVDSGGVDINTTVANRTALDHAVGAGILPLVTELLRRGAAVVRSEGGHEWSPLMALPGAVINARPIIQKLIAAGANINARSVNYCMSSELLNKPITPFEHLCCSPVTNEAQMMVTLGTGFALLCCGAMPSTLVHNNTVVTDILGAVSTMYRHPSLLLADISNGFPAARAAAATVNEYEKCYRAALRAGAVLSLKSDHIIDSPHALKNQVVALASGGWTPHSHPLCSPGTRKRVHAVFLVAGRLTDSRRGGLWLPRELWPLICWFVRE